MFQRIHTAAEHGGIHFSSVLVLHKLSVQSFVGNASCHRYYYRYSISLYKVSRQAELKSGLYLLGYANKMS